MGKSKNTPVPEHVTKSANQLHIRKEFKGQFGGKTFCGIVYKRRKFLAENIAIPISDCTCKKCFNLYEASNKQEK